MDERAFYTDSQTTKAATLNCPYCKTQDSYELRWMVRKKKDRLPGGADERDRAKFAKAQSYMVRRDDKLSCANIRCRKPFEITALQTIAFLNE
jgi:hypothetical protein